MSSSSSSSSDPGYYFKLSREPSEVYDGVAGLGYRMRITCTEAGGDTSTKIFMHLRVPTDADAPDHQINKFSHVASPNDLVSYPADDPNMSESPSFFRLDVVDLLSANLELLEETWAYLQQDVQDLATALRILDDLGEAETVTLPAE